MLYITLDKNRRHLLGSQIDFYPGYSVELWELDKYKLAWTLAIRNAKPNNICQLCWSVYIQIPISVKFKCLLSSSKLDLNYYFEF